MAVLFIAYIIFEELNIEDYQIIESSNELTLLISW